MIRKIAEDSTYESAPTMPSNTHHISTLVHGWARWGMHISTEIEVKMSLSQPNCLMKNRTSRYFSAAINRTGPHNACHNTTQQALSAHPYGILTSPSIPDLDTKSENRLTSLKRGETRLISCVCEMHEGRYSTDHNSALRARCVVSIEWARDP